MTLSAQSRLQREESLLQTEGSLPAARRVLLKTYSAEPLQGEMSRRQTRPRPGDQSAGTSLPELPGDQSAGTRLPEPPGDQSAGTSLPEPPGDQGAGTSLPEPPGDQRAGTSLPEPSVDQSAGTSLPEPPGDQSAGTSRTARGCGMAPLTPLLSRQTLPKALKNHVTQQVAMTRVTQTAKWTFLRWVDATRGSRCS